MTTQTAIDAIVPGSSFAGALPVNVATGAPQVPDGEPEAACTGLLVPAGHETETMLVPAPWLTVAKEMTGKDVAEAGEGLSVTGTTV